MNKNLSDVAVLVIYIVSTISLAPSFNIFQFPLILSVQNTDEWCAFIFIYNTELQFSRWVNTVNNRSVVDSECDLLKKVK